MHFEVLVEDQSGAIVVDHLLQKIIEQFSVMFTYRLHSYRGAGKIPANLNREADPSKRILLDRLPQFLRGFGRSLGEDSAVIVIVDNDDRDCRAFKQELMNCLHSCHPAPKTAFCLAIAEIEAWLLGDPNAVKQAYPKANLRILDHYVPDSPVDTWEVLADAVCPEKASGLKKQGYAVVGI